MVVGERKRRNARAAVAQGASSFAKSLSFFFDFEILSLNTESLTQELQDQQQEQ